MTISNLKLRSPVPFPATVTGAAEILVEKANGVWTVRSDWTRLTTLGTISDSANTYALSYNRATGVYQIVSFATIVAALAQPGPGYLATSTTSLAIASSGTKVFTTQSGLAYTNGARARATDSSTSTNWMEGTVAYSGTTLTMTADKSSGSGTISSWNINLTGQPGAGDLTAANNLSDVTTKYTAFDNLSVHAADKASAATVNLETATGYLVDITGTTTITAITLSEGHVRYVRFTGALTLTNGASLVLPGGANITTAAGDFAIFVGYAAGVVRCVLYSSLAGTPVKTVPVANGGTGATTVANARTALGVAIGTDVQAYDAQLFSNIPQNSKSANYTTVLTDSGKHIFHPSSDNNARTFTIDSNTNVAYPIGAALTFVNKINTVTLSINSDTLTLAGSGATGSRTLAANGMATAVKIATTEWMISGTGLT